MTMPVIQCPRDNLQCPRDNLQCPRDDLHQFSKSGVPMFNVTINASVCCKNYSGISILAYVLLN